MRDYNEGMLQEALEACRSEIPFAAAQNSLMFSELHSRIVSKIKTKNENRFSHKRKWILREHTGSVDTEIQGKWVSDRWLYHSPVYR